MYVQNKPSVKHIENHFISVKSLKNMGINLGDARLKIKAQTVVYFPVILMGEMTCDIF